MHSIDDLKDTLGVAGDTAGAPLSPHERLASVRRRVGVVRRRRQAGVAGVAVAAVLAVVGVTTSGILPGDRHAAPGPSDRTVAGFTVPPTMTSLGYTYTFDQAVSGKAEAELDLPASDTPRLVSWAFSGGGRARLGLPDPKDGTVVDHEVGVGRFDDFVYVHPGMPLQVRLTGDRGGSGEVGLAVYELSDPLPPGVSSGDITYRDVVNGEQLLGAKFGEPGQARIQFDVTVGQTKAVRISPACDGESATYKVLIAGEPVLSEGTCDGYDFDAGSGGYIMDDVSRYQAGDVLHVTMLARSKGTGSTPFTGRIGVGFYDATSGDPMMPDTEEEEGRFWALERVVSGTVGDNGAVPPRGAGRLLVRYVLQAPGPFGVRIQFDERVIDQVMGVDGLGVGGPTIWPGEVNRVRFLPAEDIASQRGQATDVTYRIGFYRLIE